MPDTCMHMHTHPRAVSFFLLYTWDQLLGMTPHDLPKQYAQPPQGVCYQCPPPFVARDLTLLAGGGVRFVVDHATVMYTALHSVQIVAHGVLSVFKLWAHTNSPPAVLTLSMDGCVLGQVK